MTEYIYPMMMATDDQHHHHRRVFLRLLQYVIPKTQRLWSVLFSLQDWADLTRMSLYQTVPIQTTKCILGNHGGAYKKAMPIVGRKGSIRIHNSLVTSGKCKVTGKEKSLTCWQTSIDH